MEKIRRAVIILSGVLIMAAISAAPLGAYRNVIKTDAGALRSRPLIIVDPGHGGFDGGAVAHDGTVEKDINLKISGYTADLLQFCGFDVLMTRTTDDATDTTDSQKIATRKKSDMLNRLKMMQENKNAVYLSIHLNKFTTSAASGTQVFYGCNGEDSYEMGLSVQEAVKNLLQPDNTRVIKKGTKSTYLLYNATIPAIIVECGFLSNKAELSKLKTPDYQCQMAFCVNAGIIDYFSSKNR